MELIEAFISRYEREFDFYDKVCRKTERLLDELLREAGIRAIVTSRAKSPSRLRDKLLQRQAEKNYDSVESIYNDIADLAGVRVALYFPDTNLEVDRIIKDSFVLVREEIKFPKKDAVRKTGNRVNRFPGYVAVHYRVNLKDKAGERTIYQDANVEIQVASVLMHAWSEVEHDLVYKPLSGQLSSEEYAILDEINGLVLSGEIALERLKHAEVVRTSQGNKPYRNQYELAASLIDIYQAVAKDQQLDSPDLSNIGRVNILFDMLKKVGENNPDKVKAILEKIIPDLNQETPIVEGVISQILDDYPEVMSLLAKQDNSTFSLKSLRKKSDFHLSFFQKFEELISHLNKMNVIYSPRIDNKIKAIGGVVDKLPPTFAEDYKLIRNERNKLAHGKSLITADSLLAYEKLDELLAWFAQNEGMIERPNDAV
jgi:ppGpp synthetase/RelA/SpoT-type nucleotidyltranferase